MEISVSLGFRKYRPKMCERKTRKQRLLELCSADLLPSHFAFGFILWGKIETDHYRIHIISVNTQDCQCTHLMFCTHPVMKPSYHVQTVSKPSGSILTNNTVCGVWYLQEGTPLLLFQWFSFLPSSCCIRPEGNGSWNSSSYTSEASISICK